MDRFTYKDENGNYQLDDEYVDEWGIDINGLADITDYIGEIEDLEELLGFSLTSIDDATDISSLSTSIDATMDNEIYFCADDFYGTYPVEHFQQTIKRILIESIIALKQIKKDKSE